MSKEKCGHCYGTREGMPDNCCPRCWMHYFDEQKDKPVTGAEIAAAMQGILWEIEKCARRDQ